MHNQSNAEPGPAAPRRAGPGAGAASLLAALGAAGVALLVLLINADVIGRAVFDRPLRGVTEIVSLSIPLIVFVTAPSLALDGRLIRSGVLDRWLDAGGASFQAGFRGVHHLFAAGLGSAILAATWPWLLRAWRDHEFIGVEGDFTAPLWPARLAVALGSLLVTLLALRACTTEWRTMSARPASSWLPLLLPVAVVLLSFAAPGSRAGSGGLAIAMLFVLLACGVPVAWALLSAAFVGVAQIKASADIAINTLGLAANGAVSSYVFAAVPLFVFMGLVVGRADIGRDSLHAAHWLLARLAGGLGVATVAANAVFAAITGISIASASIFSKVAVPPLIEQGYAPRFAVGIVAGSSVLGMLIPPSLLLIVYGLVAEVSINRLFIAAVVPGLLLTLLFAALVVLGVGLRRPFAVAASGVADSAPLLDARGAATRAIPVTVLIAGVLGGIYSGVFTPTEAGAVGAVLALGLALVMRRLTLAALPSMLRETAQTSASILLLIVGASAFGMMLTLSGIPGSIGAAASAAGLGLTGYVLIYLAILIVLGMVLDSTSILLIMVPLALPTIHAFGGDLVWFGIVTVIGVEIGLLTPPLGLSIFAIKSSLDDETITLGDIFRGAAPFALLMLALTLVVIAFPEVTTWL